MYKLYKEAQLELQAEQTVQELVEKVALNVNGRRYAHRKGTTRKGDTYDRLILSGSHSKNSGGFKRGTTKTTFYKTVTKVHKGHFSKYALAVAILAGIGLGGGIYAANRQ